MNNKQLLYNEKEQATNIYKNGFTNGYNRREAYLVAKYLRHIKGYKDKRLKKELIDFCSQDHEFNVVLEDYYIREIIKNSKSEFIIRSKIFITQKELDRVRQVKNFNAQKLYLGLIALAKKNKSNFVSVKNWTVLKRISSLPVSMAKLNELFHVLYLAKLIYPIFKKNIGGQKLLFMDWEGNSVLEIHTDKEFYDLGNSYQELCGGELGYCEICQEEFVKNSPRQKYCETHRKEKELERHRNYNKKRG